MLEGNHNEGQMAGLSANSLKAINFGDFIWFQCTTSRSANLHAQPNTTVRNAYTFRAGTNAHIYQAGMFLTFLVPKDGNGNGSVLVCTSSVCRSNCFLCIGSEIVLQIELDETEPNRSLNRFGQTVPIPICAYESK